MFVVYRTTHPSLGLHYTGKSSVRRLAQGYKGSGVILHRYFKKYPKDQWVTTVLATAENETEIFDLEVQFIAAAKLQPGCLNIAPGGTGGIVWQGESPLKGRKQSSCAVAAAAAARKGKKQSLATIEKRRSSLKAHKRTAEHQAAINSSLVGRSMPPASSQRKQKVSNALKGRVFTTEHKLKILLSRQTTFAVQKGLASPLNRP